MIKESYFRNRKEWETYWPYVGTHIYKDHLIRYINKSPHVPYQFFIGGRNNTHANCTEGYKRNLKKTLERHSQAKVFIHSPYTLNLSQKYVSSKEVEDVQEGGKQYPKGRWIYTVVVKLLEMGADLGTQHAFTDFTKRFVYQTSRFREGRFRPVKLECFLRPTKIFEFSSFGEAKQRADAIRSRLHPL